MPTGREVEPGHKRGRLGELEGDDGQAAPWAQHALAFAQHLGYFAGVDEFEDEAHEHGVEGTRTQREPLSVALNESNPGGVPGPG